MQNVTQIHILDTHLNKFKENMGAYSEEQGKHFHQDISNLEHRYQEQYNKNMIGDYIWRLLQENDLQYTCKSRKSTHFGSFLIDILLTLSIQYAIVFYLTK